MPLAMPRPCPLRHDRRPQRIGWGFAPLLREGAAFTLIELMVVIALVAVVAAITVANVLRGRVNANESTAIGNLRALTSSLEVYRVINEEYPGSATGWQAAMYGSSCASGVAPHPDYGPPSFCASLSDSSVQGYSYTYTAGAASNATTYTITANPTTYGITGSRAFFVDQNTIIRHCFGASGATAASKPIGETANETCP